MSQIKYVTAIEWHCTLPVNPVGSFKPNKHQWKLRTLTNTAHQTISTFHFIFSYLHNRPQFQYSFSLKRHKRITAEIHRFLSLYIIQQLPVLTLYASADVLNQFRTLPWCLYFGSASRYIINILSFRLRQTSQSCSYVLCISLG